MRILFLCPYPYNEAPSQRFRFEQYFPLLREKGISYTQLPFLDKKTWSILYSEGNSLKKFLGIMKGFLRRFSILFTLAGYDYIFIHREITPLGPPVFEWIIARIFRKKIIYDFDDAIWLPNTSDNNRIAAGLKWHRKVASICRWSFKVSGGNEFLCTFARKYNHRVILLPTTIDTQHVHNPVLYAPAKGNKCIIGWTGSHSTLMYLKEILPALQLIEKDFPQVEFHFISNKAPDLDLQRKVFKKWSQETEIEDLAAFDIGLMPLKKDLWAEGKCGFKALQYMAMEIPAVVSPVGVNLKIVEDGKNGFFADSQQEWIEKISLLIESPELRRNVGIAGRETVVRCYSVESQKEKFMALFNGASPTPTKTTTSSFLSLLFPF